MMEDDLEDLEDGAGHGAAAPGPPRLLPVEVVLTRGLGETLPRHQVHHGGLPSGQPQRGQRHVPVEEPALINQAENLSFGNRLFLPFWGPVIKHKLSDVARTLAGAEQVLPGLAAHEDQA